MITQESLRIAALESDLKETKQALGQSFLEQQAMKRMLSDMYNYLTVKSVISNKGNRDAVIEEMKLLNRSTKEAEFNKMVIPLIDANISIYSEEIKKNQEENPVG